MVYKIEAVAREATANPFEFEFDGDIYTLPSDFDMRAAAHLSAGNLEGGLRVLLGEDQWAQLCRSPLVFGIRQLTDLIGVYTETIGVELGELPASSGSSNGTVTPSKRTSNGSTASRSRTSTRTRSG